ncbi:FMN-dependent 2-nitropropane dioxygenase [Xylaria curta]|nr:FMN-dependent 2-nitropropane dioxygenase [Xylaria curta]
MKTLVSNITRGFGTGTTRRTFAMSAARAESRMQRWFPGTAHPLIVSAPMAFISNPKLASEVSRADGLGFIQGGRSFKPDSPSVRELDEQLTLARSLLGKGEGSGGHLPIGVGFVLFSDCAATHFGETTAPVLARHRPAAVWLFAPDPDKPDTLRRVVEAVRSAASAEWKPRVIVQVGTVAAARQAAELGADVIVAQGVDAGGHQFVKSAGIVSLVPEVRDMVREEFPDREIVVWAAGGIADGRGVAAALALGAEAAVMGTRYIVAPESDAQDYKRQALLSASDGAANTVKSYMHDHVQGTWNWPSLYDARALVHPSYTDDLAGMPIKENEARYKAAKEKGDFSMMVTWSGSGVGLIRDAAPAAEITKKVREEATKTIRGLKASL